MVAMNLFGMLSGIGDQLYTGLADAEKQRTLAELGGLASAGNYDAAAKLGFASGRPELGLGLLQLGREAQASSQFSRLMGGGGVAPSPAAAAPASGAASVPSMAGGGQSMRMPADPAIRDRFISTVKAGGLTNPYALAVVDAYGQAESGWSPGNATRTWSDPSQSGQPGTSGGLFSWRGPRLAAMQQATAGAEDPIAAQAKFFLTENPEVTVALQNAKSVDEAHQILANAWRFAGYDQPGQGEYQKRYNMARFASRRYAGDQTAAAPGAASTETAQADLPAPGAREVQQFAIPGDPTQIPIPPAIAARMNQLRQAAAIPGLPAAQRQAVVTELGQLQQEAQQYRQNEFTRLREDRRESSRLERERVRTVTDPAERAALGADPNYKGVIQVDGNGRVMFPGKASTEVNVNQTAEKAQDSKIGGAYGDTFNDLQKSGRSAQGQLNTFRVMEKIVDNPEFYSGNNSGLITTLKRGAASLGIKDADAAAPNELFQKLATQTVLDKLGGSLGTGVSNSDVQFMASTTANLQNTPEGNRQIIQFGKALAQREIEIAKLARKYAQAHGGRLDSGFDDELAAWAEANPLIPEETKMQAAKAQGGASARQEGSRASLRPLSPDVLSDARGAIQRGAPAAAVIQRLREQGYDPSGL